MTDSLQASFDDLNNQESFEYALPQPVFSVSDALSILNQVFETATPQIIIIGEVANFKVNQGKWVFFDIKDEDGSLSCFMSFYSLHTAVEDGMKVQITARPGLTKWGKFSLTILQIKPVGEGSIRRAFELLRAKLDKEGLFSPDRKRYLPDLPQRIAVISSVQAAGYLDFIKILGQRLGGIEIEVANVQVQGQAAAGQILSALRYFNQQPNPPEVIVLLRGGGSRDDLIAFDDERLVREIAASRVPVLTGIGHEIDVTLADLAADVRASTPSNAAEILVPDKREIVSDLRSKLGQILDDYESNIESQEDMIYGRTRAMADKLFQMENSLQNRLDGLNQVLKQLDPRLALRRGYSIVRSESGFIIRDDVGVGEKLMIESAKLLIETEVKSVKKR